MREILKLEQIYTECFPHKNFANEVQTLENIGAKLVFLEQESKIISFITYFQNADEAEVLEIATLLKYQGQGYASQNFQKLFNELKTSAINKVFLEVSAQNQPAINLYKKLGFEQISIRKNYYKTEEEKVDALIFRKII